MDFELIIKFLTPTVSLATAIVLAINARRNHKTEEAVRELKERENKDNIRRTIESEVNLTGSEEDFILGYYSNDARISIKPNPQDGVEGGDWVGLDEIVEYYKQFANAELEHGQYRHIVDNDDMRVSKDSENAIAISHTESRKSSSESWGYAYYQVWKLVKDSERYYYTWGITEFNGGLSEEEAKAEYRKLKSRMQ